MIEVQYFPTKAQHGGAHFNVLIKNPAKASSPTPIWTNESAAFETRGDNLVADWLEGSVESVFYQVAEAARINIIIMCSFLLELQTLGQLQHMNIGIHLFVSGFIEFF